MKLKKQNIAVLIALSVMVFFFVSAFPAFAQDYVPISPLPGITDISTDDPSGYFEGVLGVVIGIAGILAVILLMVYGLMYLLSASEGKKSAAKSGMTNVIFGLLIIFLSWVTLVVINPDLVSLRFFDSVRKSTGATAPSTTPPPAVSPTGPGSGYSVYQWADIPSATGIGDSKYCKDILGEGWVNVDSTWCSGSRPGPTYDCCAK